METKMCPLYSCLILACVLHVPMYLICTKRVPHEVGL